MAGNILVILLDDKIDQYGVFVTKGEENQAGPH